MVIIPNKNTNVIKVTLYKKNGKTISHIVKGVGFMDEKKLINEVCKHHGCFSEFYQIVSKVKLIK